MNWKKEILTIPNLLTCFRILLIPFYLMIYRQAVRPMDYYTAGLILSVSCATDFLDGKIARHFHMVTTFGTILDPIADKLTQLMISLHIASRYPVFRSVFLLLIFKESIQLILALYYLRQGKILRGAIFPGKLSTCVLFASMILMITFPSVPSSIAHAAAVIDSCFLLYALMGYLYAYFGKNDHLRNLSVS